MSESTLDRLLAAWDSGQEQPKDLSGTLAMADAYPMMMQVLNRRLADGEIVSGWKIGQTNYQLRAERCEKRTRRRGLCWRKTSTPVVPSLTSRARTPGFWSRNWRLVLDGELRGDDVTADDVSAAVGGIASSFEIVGAASWLGGPRLATRGQWFECGVCPW